MFGAVALRTNAGIQERKRVLMGNARDEDLRTIAALRAALNEKSGMVAALEAENAELRRMVEKPCEHALKIARAEIVRGSSLHAAAIIAEVSRLHDVPIAVIKGPRGSPRSINARFHAVYEVKRQCDWMSLPEIGRIFGDRDHTSILHAVREWPKKAAALGIPYQPLGDRS